MLGHRDTDRPLAFRELPTSDKDPVLFSRPVPLRTLQHHALYFPSGTITVLSAA